MLPEKKLLARESASWARTTGAGDSAAAHSTTISCTSLWAMARLGLSRGGRLFGWEGDRWCSGSRAPCPVWPLCCCWLLLIATGGRRRAARHGDRRRGGRDPTRKNGRTGSMQRVVVSAGPVTRFSAHALARRTRFDGRHRLSGGSTDTRSEGRRRRRRRRLGTPAARLRCCCYGRWDGRSVGRSDGRTDGRDA